VYQKAALCATWGNPGQKIRAEPVGQLLADADQLLVPGLVVVVAERTAERTVLRFHVKVRHVERQKGGGVDVII
jgi:hypothetical protein